MLATCSHYEGFNKGTSSAAFPAFININSWLSVCCCKFVHSAHYSVREQWRVRICIQDDLYMQKVDAWEDLLEEAFIVIVIEQNGPCLRSVRFIDPYNVSIKVAGSGCAESPIKTCSVS